MRFKTNAKCTECETAIKRAVKREFPDATLEMELENTDKVLHVHGIPENSHNAALVESAIKEVGFQGSWLVDGLENK